ncbi:MAG: hemolysin family protein [Candidatus Aminicenantes bacterium]|nr:hemolysin family protein [Candidatus Aminicenantes bacterium]
MILSSILLFALCVVLSAFFSSSETAFIAVKPHTLDYLEKKGSSGAGRVKKILSRVDDFLATVLIGNTLVNAAAASLATALASSLVRNENTAILLATAATTVVLLIFSEINPKIYAAHHPARLSLFVSPVIRLLLVLFYPLVKIFTFLSRLIFRSKAKTPAGLSRAMAEDEAKALLHSGIKGLPEHRKAMITEIVDLAARPVKEIMTPRPRIRAIEASSTREQILKTVVAEGFSRFPVYRGRMDHIEGMIYTKDLIRYLANDRPFDLAAVLRPPFFVPESAPIEKVLLQMQDEAVQMAFVVDEFGNMEGLVTIEDILEEIVGEIRDEYDDPEEDWHVPADDGAVVIKGSAGIKDINKTLGLGLPESVDYTTLAGFFLHEFGRIPREKDVLLHDSRRFIVVKMNKRHISQVRVEK